MIIRKRSCIILILFCLSFSVFNGQSPAGTVSRKLLFSISKQEKPVFNESSVSISPIGNNVTVVTADQDGKFFIYENGKKRGPYRELGETIVKTPESEPGEYDPVLRRESDSTYEKYLSYNDAGQVTLNFGGKSFGPFQFILEFYSTNDKSAFHAIVMQDGMPQIIGSAGNKIVLDGQPGYNCLSSNGKRLMVTTIKENNEAGELMNRDMSKLSQEELTRLKKEIEGKNINMPPQAYIWFQDGRKFGPYDPKKISINNPAFTKTGGDNWLLTMDSRLLINGKVVTELRNDQISPANVWLTDDGKRYAIIVWNRIDFSDGTFCRDPLKIRITTKQNKITVWWLLLENESDIVLYSKTL